MAGPAQAAQGLVRPLEPSGPVEPGPVATLLVYLHFRRLELVQLPPNERLNTRNKTKKLRGSSVE